MMIIMTFIAYIAEYNAEIFKNLIATLCDIAGVRVTTYTATQAAASRWLTLHSGTWHLAIVDLFLEEGKGWGVLASCRDREARQKIVLLPNHTTPEIRERAIAVGANAVFDKSTKLDLPLAFCMEHTANVKSEETQAAENEAVARKAVTT